MLLRRGSSGPPTDGGVPDAASRFLWLVGLRWVAVAGVALVLALTGALGVLPAASVRPLWIVLAGLAGYNAALHHLGPDRGWPWLTRVAGQIVADCLALALFLHFAGGVENPFLALFVLHVVNANIVLRPRPAAGILLLAIALPAGLAIAEGTGLLSHSCLRPGACWGARLDLQSLGVTGALALTLIASAFFTRHLIARLQDSERRLMRVVDELSREKRHLTDTRALIELERSRLHSVMDCIADAVTFSDLDGRLQLANERARRIEPATLAPVEAGPTDPLAAAAPADAGGPDADALTLPRRDRGGRTFEATRAVVRDPQGRPIGTVTVERDITDRVAFERHLMREERLAVVGKLSAAVAHEINNPIGVVSLYAQHALAQLPADSSIRRHLDVIHRNAESCRRIVGDLLGLARQRPPERRAVDLRALTREVARAVEPMASSAGIRVIVVEPDSADAADSIWADGDADMLYQAVLNLAVNAIEACGEGSRVTLRTAHAAGRHGVPLVIEISDTGPGVPADQRGQIFQPFYSTKPAGTGLGLAVAENIVKAHGGHIALHDAEPRGAAFRIHLPAPERRSTIDPRPPLGAALEEAS